MSDSKVYRDLYNSMKKICDDHQSDEDYKKMTWDAYKTICYLLEGMGVAVWIDKKKELVFYENINWESWESASIPDEQHETG